jgi:tRNA/tmRNA/rRNA uracil-C5-methylase (TrmA/RlmC/RlmD family)
VLSPGSLLTVEIEKPAAGGLMIARVAGEVILVRGGIPGERLRCRIQARRRGVAYATVTDVIDPHPDRRGMESVPACGGNVYAYIALPRQRALKGEIVADAFARLARLPLSHEVSVAESPSEGYRMRARLHVSGGVIGFFREGTHKLCDVASTGQLLPQTVAALSEVERALRSPGTSTISEIEIAEDLTADQRVLHCHAAAVPFGDEAGARLATLSGITGASYTTALTGGIRPLGGDLHVADRMDALVEPAPSRTWAGAALLRRRARSFFQGNRFLLRALVTRVVSLAGDGPVADLYSGVGLFACGLAAAGREHVVAVEGDPSAGEDLSANADQFQGAIRVERCAVEPFLAESKRGDFETMILDPPRTGVSADALRRVIGVQPSRLVYVSCDVATLARDARQLAGAGYQLESIEAFDLFPNTAHIETVCLFTQG